MRRALGFDSILSVEAWNWPWARLLCFSAAVISSAVVANPAVFSLVLPGQEQLLAPGPSGLDPDQVSA